MTTAFAPGSTAPVAVTVAMEGLRRLAGWRTVPHPFDTAVVRLALRHAAERTDADQGRGTDAQRELLAEIEATWLAFLGL